MAWIERWLKSGTTAVRRCSQTRPLPVIHSVAAIFVVRAQTDNRVDPVRARRAAFPFLINTDDFLWLLKMKPLDAASRFVPETTALNIKRVAWGGSLLNLG